MSRKYRLHKSRAKYYTYIIYSVHKWKNRKNRLGTFCTISAHTYGSNKELSFYEVCKIVLEISIRKIFINSMESFLHGDYRSGKFFNVNLMYILFQSAQLYVMIQLSKFSILRCTILAKTEPLFFMIYFLLFALCNAIIY